MNMKDKIVSAIEQRLLVLAEFEEVEIFQELYLSLLKSIRREKK